MVVRLKKKKKILALIPTRLNSRRLPAKALLPINNLPLIMHVYKRVLLSKRVSDAYVCCDDKKIFNVVKKYGAKVIMTSKHHPNGTDRICEAFKKIKNNGKYNLVIDVQGDEPLLSPNHIDKVIEYHEKNMSADIILPNLRVKSMNNTNIVKLVTNKKNDVLYISRANIPYEFKDRVKYVKKHLSIISFKPESLIKFGKSKVSDLEKIEDIELLRAIDEGLKIKTINLKGDSFSIDIFEDYKKAQIRISRDRYFKFYR
jgi:3-deoxy-manno-octulosonate cytidylyltransferase (CMP-KDO synthetase)